MFAKSCSACHLLEGVGHAVGPDLSALANKSPLYFLSEIFDPNRNLDSRYSEYQAITKDERTLSGVLAAETATAITLRGQQGKEETILRSDLEYAARHGEVADARRTGEGTHAAGHGRFDRLPECQRSAAQKNRRATSQRN